MKTELINIKKLIKSRLLLLLIFSFCLNTAHAISILTLPGSFESPGILDTFPEYSNYSWLSHRQSSDHRYFSWRFGGGSDGGVIFNQLQEYTEMTDTFVMFNQNTGLFSVNDGIQINDDYSIDMANLRMWQSSQIYDLGDASEFETLIPFFDDLSIRLDGQNGWSITGNEYHLFYNTRGICDTCEMVIHLHGMTVVPIPSSILLFLSGVGFLGVGFKRKKSL